MTSMSASSAAGLLAALLAASTHDRLAAPGHVTDDSDTSLSQAATIPDANPRSNRAGRTTVRSAA